MCVSSKPHAKPRPFRAKMIADREEYSSQKSVFTWQKSMWSWALTKKLAVVKGEECNLQEVTTTQKEKNKEFFLLIAITLHLHGPWQSAGEKRREQHSFKITTCNITKASIVHFLHCKSLAVVFQKVKVGKNWLATAKLGHLRACCRDLSAGMTSATKSSLCRVTPGRGSHPP